MTPFDGGPFEHYGHGYVCKVCGCTDDRACEGGCDWAAPNLCTRCAGPRRQRVKALAFLVSLAFCAGFWGAVAFKVAELVHQHRHHAEAARHG